MFLFLRSAVMGLFLLLASAAVVQAESTSNAKPPNILLIMVDDMGYTDIWGLGIGRPFCLNYCRRRK